MIWRWILCILILLIVLLCRTRAGVLVVFDGVPTVDVRLGVFRFRVFPGKEQQTKKQRRKRKEPAVGNGEGEKPKKASFPKPSAADIKDAVKTLAPPLRRALARTRRGIRVDPLHLSLKIGGSGDPAASAILYGEINAGVWAVMPALEQLLDIPDPRIHTEVDFDAAGIRPQGEAGVSIRVGTALAVGFGIAFPALRWLLAYLGKSRKQRRPAPEAPGAGAT